MLSWKILIKFYCFSVFLSGVLFQKKLFFLKFESGKNHISKTKKKTAIPFFTGYERTQRKNNFSPSLQFHHTSQSVHHGESQSVQVMTLNCHAQLRVALLLWSHSRKSLVMKQHGDMQRSIDVFTMKRTLSVSLFAI